MPNYDAIRRYHRVEAVYSDSETHRRLHEVASVPYPNDPRCKALARAVNRKSGSLNTSEQAALVAFPEQGIDLGFWAKALIFAPAFNHMPLKQHAALVSLVRLGRLGICEGLRDGKKIQILARIN